MGLGRRKSQFKEDFCSEARFLCIDNLAEIATEPQDSESLHSSYSHADFPFLADRRVPAPCFWPHFRPNHRRRNPHARRLLVHRHRRSPERSGRSDALLAAGLLVTWAVVRPRKPQLAITKRYPNPAMGGHPAVLHVHLATIASRWGGASSPHGLGLGRNRSPATAHRPNPVTNPVQTGNWKPQLDKLVDSRMWPHRVGNC